ncbi:hypothetical protein L1D40_00050 [Shewanella insulae]|uniref:hypothetical protein n=1 Tax=Shewanella insulae TaxID=2681496 RepID=UPI001EFDD8C3|nr:hypothetical protein [Shewanella insulae]MCG9714867.1 hypothetical protein [Shewanella insulae]MCG9753616.1 hypothetical protein [Shewanella insulae]
MRISPTAAYQRWTRQLPSDKTTISRSNSGDEHHRQLASAAELTQDRVTLSPLALKLSALDHSTQELNAHRGNAEAVQEDAA